MHPDQRDLTSGTSESIDLVSGRFLTDFFGALERQGIPARELVGDLPIPIHGDLILGPVPWDAFAEFMRRLSHATGGDAGIERCGEMLEGLAPSRALASLAGLAASPETLYRAAAGWVLRRAIPGIETRCIRADDGQLEIHARLADGLKPCPELFHFAAGGARVLPRTIGLRDAVVACDIQAREAHYRIAVPPSTTLFANVKRIVRTIFSAGSVLRFLEAQQLELHAKNDALQRANNALVESERRHRALTEAAVDVVCELDGRGRIVYVSASIEELIGYSREQVEGSHYRLWFPSRHHARVDEAVQCLHDMPVGGSTREHISLHARGGRPVLAELTARTYDTADGERRIVMIVRALRQRGSAGPTTDSPEAIDASMMQAVEHALAERPDATPPGPGLAWHEMAKLLQSAREAFCVGEDPTELGPDVIVELGDAPDEVWADESLFVTAVGALLRATGLPRSNEDDDGDGAPILRLHTRLAESADASERALEVHVSRVDGPQAPSIREASPRSERALALADEAARALSGQVTRDGIDGSVRLTLPQPNRDEG